MGEALRERKWKKVQREGSYSWLIPRRDNIVDFGYNPYFMLMLDSFTPYRES